MKEPVLHILFAVVEIYVPAMTLGARAIQYNEMTESMHHQVNRLTIKGASKF